MSMTGGIITAAGVIMAIAFGALIFSETPALNEIGEVNLLRRRCLCAPPVCVHGPGAASAVHQHSRRHQHIWWCCCSRFVFYTYISAGPHMALLIALGICFSIAGFMLAVSVLFDTFIMRYVFAPAIFFSYT
jgi:hypothetical protein